MTHTDCTRLLCHLCLWYSCSRERHIWNSLWVSFAVYRKRCTIWGNRHNNIQQCWNTDAWMKTLHIWNIQHLLLVRCSWVWIIYLACPMWDASYTVGPQLYHSTLFPFWGTKSSYNMKQGFCRLLWFESTDIREQIVGILLGCCSMNSGPFKKV